MNKNIPLDIFIEDKVAPKSKAAEIFFITILLAGIAVATYQEYYGRVHYKEIRANQIKFQ